MRMQVTRKRQYAGGHFRLMSDDSLWEREGEEGREAMKPGGGEEGAMMEKEGGVFSCIKLQLILLSNLIRQQFFLPVPFAFFCSFI